MASRQSIRRTRATWDKFGRRYEYFVTNYGLKTQKELAEKLGMSRQQVRKWANFLGLTSPRASKHLPDGHYEHLLTDYSQLSLTEVAKKHSITRELAWSRIRTARGRRKKCQTTTDGKPSTNSSPVEDTST